MIDSKVDTIFRQHENDFGTREKRGTIFDYEYITGKIPIDERIMEAAKALFVYLYNCEDLRNRTDFQLDLSRYASDIGVEDSRQAFNEISLCLTIRGYVDGNAFNVLDILKGWEKDEILIRCRYFHELLLSMVELKKQEGVVLSDFNV